MDKPKKRTVLKKDEKQVSTTHKPPKKIYLNNEFYCDEPSMNFIYKHLKSEYYCLEYNPISFTPKNK
jgi:hypothetical protein